MWSDIGVSLFDDGYWLVNKDNDKLIGPIQCLPEEQKGDRIIYAKFIGTLNYHRKPCPDKELRIELVRKEEDI